MVILTKYQKEFQEQHQGGKKNSMVKILVVDDDVQMLEELKDVLSSYSYEVELVANSALAFETACQFKPDIVLLDLRMKPKNGFQISNELQNSYMTSAIPIIAITGYFTEKEHVLMLKMCRVKHVILKPFNPPDLVAKIQEVLRLSQI